VTSTTHFVPMN